MWASDEDDRIPVHDVGAWPFARPAPRRWIVFLALAVLAGAIWSLFLLSPSPATASPPSTRARQAAPEPALSPIHGGLQVGTGTQPEYRLALLSSDVQVQGNNATFEGSVQNLTDRPIAGVMVVVTLYDEDKVPRTSADALIDLDPLPPGGVSRWQVNLRDHPELPLFGVEFRQAHVGTMSTRDDRKD